MQRDLRKTASRRKDGQLVTERTGNVRIYTLPGLPEYELHALDVVDSTNEWAKAEAGKNAPEGSVFLADEQTAGKGSRGRSWASPPGTSVYMSLLLRPQLSSPEKIPMITLVLGLSAAQGIRAVSGVSAGIKWPNDVVSRGRKLCGILTELHPQSSAVIAGIGINVNTQAFPKELEDRASSLFLESGSAVDREEVIKAVLEAFSRNYRLFLQTEDLRLLKEDYEELLVNRQEEVRILGEEEYTGTALGIDSCGELLVRRSDTLCVEKIRAGEVSVRGVYGYV